MTSVKSARSLFGEAENDYENHFQLLSVLGTPVTLTVPNKVYEEASGIIDASELIGPGWFLFDLQAHYSHETELVEGGQMLALYDPAAL